MPAPSTSRISPTSVREYAAFPVVLATFVTDLGGTPTRLYCSAACTLTIKLLDGVSRALTVPSGAWVDLQISEITSCTAGVVAAYRSPEV